MRFSFVWSNALVALAVAGCSSGGTQGGNTPLDGQGLDGVDDTAGGQVDADTVSEPPPDGDTTGVPVDDPDAVGDADLDANDDVFDVRGGPVGEPCGPDLPNCPNERPVCESVYGVCVECEVERARSRLSGGCYGDDEYCGPDWRCHPATHCYLDLDCKSSPHGSHCDLQTYRCGQCGTDWDCGDDERCQDGTCIAATRCTKSHDCESPTPVCDPSTNRCVGCIHASIYTDQCGGVATRCVNRQCQRLDVAGERSCAVNSDCFDLGVDCDPESGRCRPCASDADCPERRWCHTGSGQCLRDACSPGAKRCGTWCDGAALPGATCYNYIPPGLEQPGVGAVQTCASNGSGWKAYEHDICQAPEQCVNDLDIVRCKTWATCEPGEVFCDSYTSHAVCQDDFTLAWSACPEPRVCGAGGQCILP